MIVCYEGVPQWIVDIYMGHYSCEHGQQVESYEKHKKRLAATTNLMDGEVTLKRTWNGIVW